MMLILAVVALLVLSGAHTHNVARYDNYKVIRVTPTSNRHLDILSLLQNSNQYDFWTSPRAINSSVDIMVPPHKLAEFTEFVNQNSLRATVNIRNVQMLIEAEQSVVRSRDPRFGWSSYYRLNEIYSWLDLLASNYPNKVTTIVGGTSYENRQIKGVKVSYKTGNPGVFVEAGIHAREWISPATVTWILNQLLTSKDPDVRYIAENYDWYIFPSVNPDGYEYTHLTNRLWRKTRSRNGAFCYGADPNRNWGFHWMDGGASSEPCSETYAGSKAFSEIEAKSLSEFISSISNNIQVFLGFHSYSQLLLIPYGFSNEHISNYDFLMDVGGKAVKSLAARYGTKYKCGNIVDVIYVASGGSMDWVRGTYGTSVTYTYELRDTGYYGFILPPHLIVPTAEETMDSVITILKESHHVALQDLAQRSSTFSEAP